MKKNLRYSLVILSILLGCSRVHAASGGPDAFGYTFKDQAAVNGPKYNWIEIATPAGGTGTLMSAIACDDCHQANIPLGFTFPYYGTNFTSISVGSNGPVYFEDVYLGLSNTCIPASPSYTMSQARFIAAMWDDLAPNYQGGVYTKAFPNYFVIEYYDVVPCCSAGDGDTWQIILFSNGNILFQYKELSNQGLQNDYTIGIQNTPSVGLQYRCDATGTAVATGGAILFEHPSAQCGAQSQTFLGANTGFCPSGSVVLNTAPSAIATTWSNNTYLSSITTSTAGTYSAIVLNNTGCTTLDTVTVSAYSNPVVNLGPDATACGSVILDAGNPGSTYAWSNGGSAQTSTITSSGTYSVTVTAPTACVGSDAITLTVNPYPTAVISGPSGICDGSSATINVALTGTAPYNFTWSNGTTTTPVTGYMSNSYSFTANPLIPTTYSITALNDALCTATAPNYSATAPVNIIPRPTGTVAVSGASTICNGDNTDITFSFTGTGPWNFSFFDGTSATPLTASVSPLTLNLSPTTNTTYTIVTLNDASCTANSGDINTTSAIVTVNDQPAITTGPANATLCSGNTASFTVAATGGNLIYEWMLNGAPLSDGGVYTGTNITTLNISDVTNLTGASYSVEVSNGCGTPVTSTPATLTVNTTNTWDGSINKLWSDPANWSCGVVPNMYTDVVIPAGPVNMPEIDINNAVCNDITLAAVASSLSFTGAGNQLSVYGDIMNSAGGSFDGTDGTVELAGAAQSITGVIIFDNLEVNGGGTKMLNSSAWVNGMLSLISGYLQIGTNNLTIADMDIQSTGSSASFVVTDNTGVIVGQNMASAPRTFHVGTNNTSYNPVTIANAGTADTFSVRVMPHVYEDGDGTNPAQVTNPVVDRTWMISEQTPGGSFATVTPQWNGVEQLNGFDINHVYVAHYMGGEWTSEIDSAFYAPAAAGTDPYTTTEDSITSFSPFTVASYGQFPLSIKLTKVAATNIGTRNRIDWSAAVEEDLKKYDIQRSVDGKSFTTIGSQNGKGNASNYILWDETPLAGINYYRIAMEETNGKTAYSKTVSAVVNDKSVFNIEAYPNPVQEKVSVKINGIINGNASVQLTDLSGKVLKNVTLGNNLVEIDTHGLAAGNYFITYRDDNRSETIKITKK